MTLRIYLYFILSQEICSAHSVSEPKPGARALGIVPSNLCCKFVSLGMSREGASGQAYFFGSLLALLTTCSSVLLFRLVP